MFSEDKHNRLFFQDSLYSLVGGTVQGLSLFLVLPRPAFNPWCWKLSKVPANSWAPRPTVSLGEGNCPRSQFILGSPKIRFNPWWCRLSKVPANSWAAASFEEP